MFINYFQKNTETFSDICFSWHRFDKSLLTDGNLTFRRYNKPWRDEIHPVFKSLLHATLSGTVIFLLLWSFRCQACPKKTRHYSLPDQCHPYSDAWWWQHHDVSFSSRNWQTSHGQGKDKCTKQMYRDILDDDLLQNTLDLGLGQKFNFQHNNSCRHTANTTNEWLRDCQTRNLNTFNQTLFAQEKIVHKGKCAWELEHWSPKQRKRTINRD